MIDPIEHAVYKIRNTRVLRYPFPHFVVEDVFPLGFYEELQTKFSGETVIKDDNPHRHYFQVALSSLQSPILASAIITMFEKEVVALALPQPTHLGIIARPVSDFAGYELHPHTDDAVKMISLLFYMDEGEGTSIYLPKDRLLRSTGNIKHDPAEFDLIYTVPRKPNSVFGFIKGDYSWHGVEPSGGVRNSILYTITTGLTDEQVEKYQTRSIS